LPNVLVISISNETKSKFEFSSKITINNIDYKLKSVISKTDDQFFYFCDRNINKRFEDWLQFDNDHSTANNTSPSKVFYSNFAGSSPAKAETLIYIKIDSLVYKHKSVDIPEQFLNLIQNQESSQSTSNQQHSSTIATNSINSANNQLNDADLYHEINGVFFEMKMYW